MISPDHTLSRIDRHLDSLYMSVGSKENINFFKESMVAGFKDNPKYLELNIACAKDVHQEWEKWKANCSSQADKVHEYEEKLKTCDGYLKLMESILLEEIKKETKIAQSSVTSPKAENIENKEEQTKKNQIEVLLKREERSGKFRNILAESFPADDVDKAFEIVKTLEFSPYSQVILDDIFLIYLAQNSLEYCKKAYKLAIFVKQIVPEHNWFLDQIIEKCMSLKTTGAELFLAEILKYYPNCNEAIIQEQKHLIKPRKPWKLETLNNELIKKGDVNAIKEREAENLADKRQFKEALAVAQTISDLNYRNGTIIFLYDKCLKFGDEEALRFAIEFSVQHEESRYRDSDLYGVFEACKKHKLRGLAIEAANLIEDPTLRKKVMEKINRAPEFRDFESHDNNFTYGWQS